MIGYTSKVKELNAVIEKLYMATGESECEEICSMLDEIYLTPEGEVDPEFRHEYTSISGKIRELNAEKVNGEKVFSLDYLLHNISYVYDYAVCKNKPYVKNLFKLKDHIGLEAGRITLVEEMQWQISNGQESVKANLEYTKNLAESFDGEVRKSKDLLEKLQSMADNNDKQIENAKEALSELKQTSDDIVDKAESVQKDSVTILGIFASIVLSFTAGMVFSSSVLENIDKASPYRIVGVILLIGAVITNLVVILLIYIDKVRMVKTVVIEYPKCIKVMNGLYIAGFIADFIAWILLEKVIWNCI